MKKIYFFTILSFLCFGKMNSQIAWTIYTASNSPLTSDYYGPIDIDQNGNIWVASNYQGLFKFDGTTWTKFSTSNSNILYNDVYDVMVDNSNKVWAANYKGVSVYNGTNFTNYDTINAGFNGYSVYSLGKDKNGIIWLSSRNGSFGYQGITTFNGTTWTNLTGYPSQINGGEFADFAFNSANTAWIASGTGVTRHNGSFTFYPKATTGLWSSDVVGVDASDNVWWAGFDGILKYNGTSWTYFDNVLDLGLTSNTIYYDMLIDGNIIWLGSTSGLLKFDRISGTLLANYTSSNSPLPTNGVIGIAKDASNYLWFGTEDMVVKSTMQGVGVDENVIHENFNVYPNPSEGIFNLVTETAKKFSYKIYSATGVLVQENALFTDDFEVDLSNQAPGLYLMHLNVEHASPQVIKLMKK